MAARNYTDDFWVCRALKEAAKHDKVVFTDCRFRNEARAIRNCRGSRIIRVHRPQIGQANYHLSEEEQKSIQADIMLINDGDLMDLERKVDRLVQILHA